MKSDTVDEEKGNGVPDKPTPPPPRKSDQKREFVIISPHPDDEIIGNFEVLMNPLIKPIIIYTENVEQKRREEALKLKTFLDNIQVQMFQKSIPTMFLNPNNILYFPDHIHETHPMHRKWGAIGEDLFRQGFNVVFYSIAMNSPYIHEVKEFKQKRHLLEKVYPSQKNLWKFENKFFLFEGRYQFLL